MITRITCLCACFLHDHEYMIKDTMYHIIKANNRPPTRQQYTSVLRASLHFTTDAPIVARDDYEGNLLLQHALRLLCVCCLKSLQFSWECNIKNLPVSCLACVAWKCKGYIHIKKDTPARFWKKTIPTCCAYAVPIRTFLMQIAASLLELECSRKSQLHITCFVFNLPYRDIWAWY